MENVPLQHIPELDTEQLEGDFNTRSDGEATGNSDESFEGRGDGGAGPLCGFTFDTSLAGMHAYLGEVDDIACRRSFLDGGTRLTLPMFYLEGIVLFPGATLPLRVLQPRFIAAVELAMQQEEAPCTLGIIHVGARTQDNGLRFALVGTTAEIRQRRVLEDGSINVVTRGRQRFHTLHAWVNVDGVPCAEVQIIPEDIPLHIPKDAFAVLASVPNFQSGKISRMFFNDVHNSRTEIGLEGSEEEISEDVQNIANVLNPTDRVIDESREDQINERRLWSHRREMRNARQAERPQRRSGASELCQVVSDHATIGSSIDEKPSIIKGPRSERGWQGACKAWALDESKKAFRAQRTAWPHWVYRMFDAYSLARRAADMWCQNVELPSIHDMVKKPNVLSYHIASKIPVQDVTRQELLEIDGVVPRLQKEIQLLESLDHIRCKNCMTPIAQRSDMLVMSSDGPMGAYVNNFGYVHETLTLHKAHGLNLRGQPETQHSWFPGYSWTIAYCGVCESHMGWLFKAVRKNMRPRLFWGVRSCQLAENSS